MKQNSSKSAVLLFLTAMIWGVAFVAQSEGTNYAEPFTFNCVRSLMGGLVLIPCIWFLNRGKGQGEQGQAEKANAERAKAELIQAENKNRKVLLTGGILCGIILCIASNLQQFGVEQTTAGKAGFITALYIVIVPVMGLFLKKTVGLKVWISVALAAVGLYFLCITETLTISTGDLFVLACAVCFSVHILVIDYFSPRTDGVKMACIQFLVCGVLSGIPMLIFEHPAVSSLLAGWLPITYAGILSCGVAYTLQIVGQKNIDPTVASLILSMESVVSVLAGFVLLNEKLTGREIFGCILMFSAIVLAQLPARQSQVTAAVSEV